MRRSDGKLLLHVMVYFVMALALFADKVMKRSQQDWLLIADRNSNPAPTGRRRRGRGRSCCPIAHTRRCWSKPPAGQDLDPQRAMLVRSHDGAYHQRQEHKTGSDLLKTHLRGPGRALRPTSLEMVHQGYLRLPAHLLRDQRPDLPSRHRGRARRNPYTGQETQRRWHPA